MAFVMYASRGASHHHEDCAATGNRPWLSNQSGTNKKRYCSTTGTPFQNNQIYNAEELDNACLDPFDSTIGTNLQDIHLNEDSDDVINNNFSEDLNLNEINKALTKEAGVLIEEIPYSLVWPISSSNKNRRLAEIKKQVKQLSSVIKMTIGSPQDGSALEDGTSANPPPFSPHVDMTRTGARTFGLGADESNLPSWDDLSCLLRSGRLKEAKHMIRESNWGLSNPIREHLWKELCQYHSKETFTSEFYWDTVQQIYGTKELSECQVVLPPFIDHNNLISHELSPRGVSVCQRIISVIAYCFPAVTYAPALYPIAAVLLHYNSEPDVYNCLAVLIGSSNNMFITQTKVANEAMWHAVLTLGRKHVRGAFSTLNRFGGSKVQTEEGFQSWLWWIMGALPLTHLVRVLDCFFLEGSKVLMRTALALFHLFIKLATRDSSVAATLPSRGLYTAIMNFCQNVNVTPNKLLKTAFGIRAFSKSEIRKVILQTEMLLKSRHLAGNEGAPHTPMTRSLSLEGLPTSQSQADIQMMSHTFTIKELLTLWAWIPMRMTMTQPVLVYTTEEHGSSLTTFFQRAEKYEPTLLLIRTTKDDVFGAYCSTAWEQRNIKDEYGNRQTYFGTGETFLFSLRPTVVKYQWVGITKQQQDSSLSHIDHSLELFMHADNDMITIGGGNGQGLMLDHELCFGKTEHCQTFDNPPLCPESDFDVKVVEVYALTHP